MTSSEPQASSTSGTVRRPDPLDIARLIQAEAGSGQRLPPVHLWNPPLSGDIDREIRRNGQWFYLGTPINRAPLVKLFSTVLRHDEDGGYYLVTPVEKWRLRVEDAPFLITTVERLERDGMSYLQMTTQTGDVVVAGEEHPIRLAYQGDEPAPYVLVRDRLEALIGRNAYYQLVEWGRAATLADGREALMVASAGQDFVIGHF
ncbi:MAG: DUF1285 domain-containing protein [Perlucidibaca sp.]